MSRDQGFQNTAGFQKAKMRIARALRNGAPELHLSDLALTTLPDSIADLTRLRRLNLANNRLSALPEGIAALTNLESLLLFNNQLRTLPDWIANLTQLQWLDLASNQLAALPEALAGIGSLNQLYLQGNNSLGIPPEILGMSRLDAFFHGKPAAAPTSILDYYFSTRGGQGRALRELKLVVVGRGGAGKTSLIRRLNGQPFNPSESETHG